MYITCLDLEGVLVPEIWIAFAKETGIDELKLTTRDIPDYNELMQRRLEILHQHNLGLPQIQATIQNIYPMEGACEFLDELRQNCQVIILSDTFTQFALPLMQKLNMPTIFCNTLEVAPDGAITDYKLRQENGKYHAVKALQSIGYDTIAAGDSFNDLAMIKNSKAGFLFKAPAHIIEANPSIPAYTTYKDLLAGIKQIIHS